MPLTTYHLNLILFLITNINIKQFLFHSWKISAEGQSPIKYFFYNTAHQECMRPTTVEVLQNLYIEVSYKTCMI